MKILLVSTQRIGDVLLTTPLVKSIKEAYPTTLIDILVCSDTKEILEGNENINSVIAILRKSKKIERLAEIYQLWNQYDISISTIPSDRARIYAWAAAKRHFGTYSEDDSFIFKQLMHKSILFDNKETHTVEMNLKICDLMGIPKIEQVTAPLTDIEKDSHRLQQPYAVLHPYPKFRYKAWAVTEWQQLVKYLNDCGLGVVISGGTDADEIKYCKDLQISSQIKNLAGELSLAELTAVISKAELYVGVDTSVTHMAAATGIKVFAIYGPTNPVKWGPWPSIRDAQRPAIWLRHDQVPQHHSNITLIQGQQSCVPCAEEGCEKHIDSESKCLTSLTSAYVIQEVDKYLRSSRAAYAL
jgi:heptosyltransferase-3